MKEFDKYEYYQKAVQSPENDALFMNKVYQDQNPGKTPNVLREDFCAAFALCCEWVKLDENKSAVGIDLDPEPIGYGRENYLSKLEDEQQKRVNIIEADVLSSGLPKADIVAALNFSYFGFKKRKTLLEYFKAAHQSLADDGILVLDCFGGSGCMEPNEHETEHDDYSYTGTKTATIPLPTKRCSTSTSNGKAKRKEKRSLPTTGVSGELPSLKTC